MARRTFFSFHYQRDVWRASVVRNSSKLKANIEPEWIDASLWEDAKKTSERAVQKLIDDALYGTSVTAVLIGTKTASRQWVKYEIDQSIARGNGMFGIYIHSIKDKAGWTDSKGLNPLPSSCKTYDWMADDGYTNLGAWAEQAYANR